MSARQRASRNAPLAGFRPAAAPHSGHVLVRRDVAGRRWVMSHTTGVSGVSPSPIVALTSADGLGAPRASASSQAVLPSPVHKPVHKYRPLTFTNVVRWQTYPERTTRSV